MQGPMLIALRRFTQLLRVHIYVPGCCKYIRMANGLQPLAELCMDGSYADLAAFRSRGYCGRSIHSQLRRGFRCVAAHVTRLVTQRCRFRLNQDRTSTATWSEHQDAEKPPCVIAAMLTQKAHLFAVLHFRLCSESHQGSCSSGMISREVKPFI